MKHRILIWKEFGGVALCDYCDNTFWPNFNGEGIWLREPIIEEVDEEIGGHPV